MAERAASVSEQRFVPLGIAAARFGCHRSTLRELILSGELAAVRFGKRGHWRISEDSLQKLVERSWS